MKPGYAAWGLNHAILHDTHNSIIRWSMFPTQQLHPDVVIIMSVSLETNWAFCTFFPSQLTTIFFL